MISNTPTCQPSDKSSANSDTPSVPQPHTTGEDRGAHEAHTSYSTDSTMAIDAAVYNDDVDYDVSIVEKILEACAATNSDRNNNICDVQSLIHRHGSMYGCYALPSTGMTPLMVAASVGNIELVQYLLNDCGAPWNAVDRMHHYCAGDYATQSEHWEIVNTLVDWATRAELILGAIEREQRNSGCHDTADNIVDGNDAKIDTSTKPDYLRQRLQYTEDGNALIDADKDAVMMEWERPIMRAHAKLMMESPENNPSQGFRSKRVLNVGFGMGIIDTILQEEFAPVLHIIIEAHPDVYRHMIQKGWDKKLNVRVCFGTWQIVLPQLKSEGCVVDAIFFDTYGEHYLDMVDFHEQMVHLLAKPHGIYSFFNGLAPDNLFFHGVACQCVKIQLSALGIDSEFVPCEIQVPNETVWKDIRRKYWYGRDTYYLPICTWNQEYLATSINPNADIITKLITHQKRKYDGTVARSDMDVDDAANDNDNSDGLISKRLQSSSNERFS